MTYWAKYFDKHTETLYKALAYRSGRGRVATLFTTYPDVNEGRFIYLKKWQDSTNVICNPKSHELYHKRTYLWSTRK